LFGLGIDPVQHLVSLSDSPLILAVRAMVLILS
jgi:hypothetical protein